MRKIEKKEMALCVCLIVMIVLTAGLFTGCGGQENGSSAVSTAGTYSENQGEANTAEIFAMDTVMDLTVYGADDALMKQAEERVTELEGLLSTTDDKSEIYSLNENGKAELSQDTVDLLKKALEMCRKTDGALDISIYPVVREWGFTTGKYKVPEDSVISELLGHVDWRKITLNEYEAGSTGNSAAGAANLPEGMKIDLGSVAKGYTGDELIKLFKSGGVTSALLNLGGNVQTIGSKPDGSAWRVAVQDPENMDDYIGVVEVAGKAVITSGGYERYFEENGEKYWHIIDPATGKPAKNGLVSVTVVGEEGVVCDALSTSLFIKGLDKASEYWKENQDFDAVFITDDGEIYITEGLEDSFSLMSSYADRNVSVIR